MQQCGGEGRSRATGECLGEEEEEEERPWVIVATAFPTPPRTSPAARLRDTKHRSSLGSNQSLGNGESKSQVITTTLQGHARFFRVPLCEAEAEERRLCGPGLPPLTSLHV